MHPQKRLKGVWLVALCALAGCDRPSKTAEAVSGATPSIAPTEFAAKSQASTQGRSSVQATAPESPPVPAQPLPPGPPLGVTLSLTGPVDVPYALSSGVPFPRGSATSLAHLRLEDAAGQARPAQFTPLAQWPDGSYKSILVSTNIERGALRDSFILRSGPDVTPELVASPLIVADEADGVTVTTGPIRFVVSKRRFGLFEQVWVDDNQNGTFEDTERLLSQPSDIVLITKADQPEYRASGDTHPTVTLEESGPLRIVLRSEGALTADGGKTLTRCIVRITAQAGRDAVRVDQTLVDPREERDVTADRRELALNAVGYGIRLPLALSSPAQGTFGGDRMQNYQAYAGPLLEHQFIYQGGEFNYDGGLGPFTFFYEGVGKGEKVDGWVDASDQRRGITAMVRAFWQQFPKELAIDQGVMTVWLHPPRASQEPAPDRPGSKRYERPKTLYFQREGGAKTYQLLFAFHRGPADSASLRGLYDTFQDSPRLMPSSAWICRSGVFGNLIEAGPWSQGYDQSLINDTYARSVEQKLSTGGLAVLYGWRDYGDRLRPGWAAESKGVKIPGFYNDTHVGAHNFIIQYLRTADPRWWDLGEIASRHWMDIDVSHANRLGYWKKDGKYVGFGPGEGHLIKHEMIDHETRNLHWGHAHLSGLQDYYLLTGDRRALDVMREVGNWWSNAVPVFYPTPVKAPHYAEAERDYGWPLFVLNEAYRATGDLRYHRSAAQIVKHLLGWWQIKTDHLVAGKVVGRNDWEHGTGYWTMNPKCDNCPEGYNGCNPWMAGALISAVIEFREADRDHHLLDGDLIDTMALQAMNYVVKYGWDAQKQYFVYSEAGRDLSGGHNHLLFPLAYLWERYQAGVPHAEWYDTAPQWIRIARSSYRDYQEVKPRSNTDLGFYGYEMVLPADFFTLMQELDGQSSATARP